MNGLGKWETGLLSPEIFHWNDPKSRIPYEITENVFSRSGLAALKTLLKKTDREYPTRLEPLRLSPPLQRPPLLLFLLGYPARASAAERVSKVIVGCIP